MVREVCSNTIRSVDTGKAPGSASIATSSPLGKPECAIFEDFYWVPIGCTPLARQNFGSSVELSMPRVLGATDWTDLTHVELAHRLLEYWISRQEIQVHQDNFQRDILLFELVSLLRPETATPHVMRVAIAKIRDFAGGDLGNNPMLAADCRLHLRAFLPQLVLAALKTPVLVSPILDLLLEWGLASPCAEGLELFWILWVEAEHGCQRAKHVIEHMMGFMGFGVLRANFVEQVRLWGKSGVFHKLLLSLGNNTQDSGGASTQTNDQELYVDLQKRRRILSKNSSNSVSLLTISIPPSLMKPPSLEASAENPNLVSLSALNRASFSLPRRSISGQSFGSVEAKSDEQPADNKTRLVRVLLRNGRDLRPHQVVRCLFQIMNHIWLITPNCGVTQELLVSGKVTPTSENYGAACIDANFKTMSELGGKTSLKRYLQSSLQDLEPAKREDQNQKITDRVLYTAAANYVADRVLGLRNYNDDNIVVLPDGTICQTHFDNIFGHVVEASSCEYPALISPALGKFLDQTENSWPIFRRYSQMLYAKLRTHHQLLLEQLRMLTQPHKADHGDRLMWHAPHYVAAMLHLKMRESSALVTVDMELKRLKNLVKTSDFQQLREKHKSRSIAPVALDQRLRALLARMNSNGEFGMGMMLPNGDRVDSLVPEQCRVVMSDTANSIILTFRTTYA